MANTLLGVASVCFLELTAALGASPRAQAQDIGRYSAAGDHFYREPQEAPQGLRFAGLEAAMDADPQTWSSDPGWQLHRTPASQLTQATDTLRSAIPTGTAVNEAAVLLHRAGADCDAPSASRMVCHYRDAETPFGGQYFDNILWRVWLDLADGRVGTLTVTRDWTRR